MSTNDYEYACEACGHAGHFLDFYAGGPMRAPRMACNQCGSPEITHLSTDTTADTEDD
jgi:hypothetical protein